MWLTHYGRNSVVIDERVFRRLLSYYPEEDLLSRPIPSAALRRGKISKSDLVHEAETLFIPWQMFLLTWNNLVRHLKNIETHRSDKIKVGQLTQRAGRGGSPPYRLIDRYIRAQNFLVSSSAFPLNKYVGSLDGCAVNDAVNVILDNLVIDRQEFWGKRTKEMARDYLIERLASHQINVAIGTSEARLVPSSINHRNLYKNMSGFCLREEHVPFIYVNANMANEEEPIGRQIYTLVYLLALVGLDFFTYTRDLRPNHVGRGESAPYLRIAHRIASEFLLPTVEFEQYQRVIITADIVAQISDRHKITPSAVLYRLLQEDYISKDEKNALAPDPFVKTSRGRTVRIENAVRKLNGSLVVSAVTTAFTSGTIFQNQAQYILFGRIRRKIWRSYKTNMGI